MGANAQTAVPAFVAGEILTAAEMTQVNTGIPVFATTTTRDAAFGGTGEKTLAEGQYAYIEATNSTQFYDGSSWQSVGVSPGLVLVSTTPVSGTSFSVNNCFSATYKNYRIIYDFTVADQNMVFRLRVGGADNSTSNYDRVRLIASGSSAGVATTSAATSWTDYLGSDGASFWIMDITNPFETAKTSAFLANGYNAAASTILALGSLQQRQATSFDGFTISGGNTMTGTCYVYGYSLA
jgi:hypothetical protein